MHTHTHTHTHTRVEKLIVSVGFRRLWVHLGTCYRVQLMDYIIERFQDMEFEPPIPKTKLKRKGDTMRGYFIIEPSKSRPKLFSQLCFGGRGW